MEYHTVLSRNEEALYVLTLKQKQNSKINYSVKKKPKCKTIYKVCYHLYKKDKNIYLYLYVSVLCVCMNTRRIYKKLVIALT